MKIRACLCAVALLFGTTLHAQGTVWKPERSVEFVVGSSPGGGTDITARTLLKIIQDQKSVDGVMVVNKPGGGQTVSWVYLNQTPGDAHRIGITNEPLITNRIMGISPLNYTDFTPLALLFNEYVVFAVKPDSPLRDGAGLVAQLKKDVASVAFGQGSSRGNNAHISISLLSMAAGGDPKRQKMIVLKSGGETQTALMGGHIDVGVSSVAAAVQHISAGRIRALAVTSPQRLAGDMAAVPTWKELGIDLVYGSWRVAFGPAGLTDAQVAYWENVLRGATRSEDWKQALERYQQVDSFRTAGDARKFLDAEAARLQYLFAVIGLAK